MSLIEILRKLFRKPENKQTPLTDDDRYRIWGLIAKPVFEEIVKLVSPNFGEIPPATPGYEKEVVKRKADLSLQHPGFNILEKRVIDPVTRLEDPKGRTVLIVVPTTNT